MELRWCSGCRRRRSGAALRFRLHLISEVVNCVYGKITFIENQVADDLVETEEFESHYYHQSLPQLQVCSTLVRGVTDNCNGAWILLFLSNCHSTSVNSFSWTSSIIREFNSASVSLIQMKHHGQERENEDGLGVDREQRATAAIQPLFLEGSQVMDNQHKRIALFYNVTTPQDLQILKPEEIEADNMVISFQGEWQVIPAENIVAAFQGFKGAVLAVSTSSTDAQVFLEALEQGLDGVVLKVDSLEEIIRLKGYFDRRNANCTRLELTRATISKVEVVGMGDRVCVDLCSLMSPGEGLLVGSFARGLFLVHSECLETNYIASRPFRVNAGPVHAYVAVPGGKTSYLSELCAGKEVLVVDQKGSWRTATVGRVKIESRPLILVEAKEGDETYNIFLQNAETVGLICPGRDDNAKTVVPVTSLKVGDEVLLRKQGGARHTGIEIAEFIVEK
ncbi:3-dehydroquinate synthase [Carex littledalei]|uniref:3-dehydroquinate synthase n=1 Tax=Carex littledalei TaxID=544730 RepID=A0A833QR94_9POAL|nr:3-dehydroquinate synthase [Carex littledalei]